MNNINTYAYRVSLGMIDFELPSAVRTIVRDKVELPLFYRIRVKFTKGFAVLHRHRPSNTENYE